MGRDPAILFEPADQPLDPVALTVSGLVEVGLTRLIFAGRNDRFGPALPETATGRRAGVTPVPTGSAGPQARSASARARHGALVHQRIERELLVALARRQHRRDGFAASLGAQM